MATRKSGADRDSGIRGGGDFNEEARNTENDEKVNERIITGWGERGREYIEFH